MSEFGEILNHLSTGTRVPDELREQLAAEELGALRAIEETMRANHTWRVMSTKLLDVSQMLNSGRESTDIFLSLIHISEPTRPY